MFEESEFRIHEMVSFFASIRATSSSSSPSAAAIEDSTCSAFPDEFRDKESRSPSRRGVGLRVLRSDCFAVADYLKVTKGLVSTLAAESDQADLVRMLVDLAGKIGAKTIAEGIGPSRSSRRAGVGHRPHSGLYVAHPHEQLSEGDAEVAASMSRRQPIATRASDEATATGTGNCFYRSLRFTACRSRVPPL